MTKIAWIAGGLSVLVLVIAALIPADSIETKAPPLYNEDWCEAMMATPGGQWRESETLAFSQNCLEP